MDTSDFGGGRVDAFIARLAVGLAYPETAGSHQLTFAVSDGYADDRQTVIITVA